MGQAENPAAQQGGGTQQNQGKEQRGQQGSNKDGHAGGGNPAGQPGVVGGSSQTNETAQPKR